MSLGYTLMKRTEKGAGHAPRSHNYHSRSLYGVFSTPSPFSLSTKRSRVGFHIFLNHGLTCYEAIDNMRAAHGGVARKQPIPEINGIYNDKIEQMLSYVQESMENEMEAN